MARNVNSGVRLEFDCVSNSSQSGVAVITGRSGTVLTSGGIWQVGVPFNRPGAHRVQAVGAFTASHQGIYTCTIDDDNSNSIALNVGLYPHGFSGEYTSRCFYVQLQHVAISYNLCSFAKCF